jgi:hypothetical protein
MVLFDFSRDGGRLETVLGFEKAEHLKIKSNSPVPAGSRVPFFAGPKKGTKERTCHWRGARFCQYVTYQLQPRK